VKEALLRAAPVSIILMHMNHPEGQTAEGVMEAIPELRKHGFRFVKLSNFGLK
jgi:peptidoglycan/xylan/chitin deacetylase (PgdA/CDA1 family)